MNEQYSQAVAAIEAADLPATIYRTARRLLDLAATHDGYLELTPVAMKQLCDTTADGTMRSHLIQMTLGGILAYNNSQKHGRIAVRFAAYPIPIIESWSSELIAQRAKTRAERSKLIDQRSKLIAQRAEMIDQRSPDDPAPDDPADGVIDQRSNLIAQRAEMIAQRSQLTDAVEERSPSDQNRALVDQNRSPSDQNRALVDHLGGRGVGWLVGSDPIPSFTDLPTNQPTGFDEGENHAAIDLMPAAQNEPPIQTPNEPRPNPLDQARSMALLLDAGVIPHNAKRLSAANPFERVQRCVGYWYDGKGTKFADTPGLVVTLLDDWNAAGVPVELPRAFLVSDLYRRHRTPAQIAADTAWDAQRVIRTGLELHPTPPPTPPPPAEPAPLAKLWQETLAGYQEHSRFMLRDTRLETIANGQAVITGPRQIETIFSRMAWKILKDLQISGQAVREVVFQAAEVAYG